MINIYTVVLDDGTVGTISDDTLDGQSADAFMGEVVTVHLHNEDGCPIEVSRKLAEVL